VIQHLSARYNNGDVSKEKFLAELDRYDFYERNCAGALWPWGTWSFLKEWSFSGLEFSGYANAEDVN
jgi:hypothetical protein